MKHTTAHLPTTGLLGPATLLMLGLSAAPQAQLPVPPIVNNPVESATRQVEVIRRDVERQTARRLDNRVTGVVADTLPTQLPEALAQPSAVLGELPDVLPVLNAQGTTAFADVRVEGGWRAVERQWLVMLVPGELPLLAQVDAEILEQTQLDDLGMNLVRFRVPEAVNSRQALQQQLPQDLVERLDRNHIYSPQNDTMRPPAPAEAASAALCEQPLKIGMVDTAIATDHPGFADARIVQQDFLAEALGGAESVQQPQAHGTAVAGLLVAATESAPARLPGATLYNASVFYSRNQYAQGATMMHLVKGLNWLLQEDVSVINMSLAGPDNQVLSTAIQRITERGKAIVAAAGNEGPAAPPLFPAAYPGVIAATAVDSDRQIYRWANRGEHIDFAATGVSVFTARSSGEFGRESGTSMAAPVVTAFVACELVKPDASVQAVIKVLAERAEDLGDRGRDPVFGYGLLR